MELTKKNAEQLWEEISELKEQVPELQDFKAFAEPYIHRHTRELGPLHDAVRTIERVSACSFSEHNDRLEALEGHLQV